MTDEERAVVNTKIWAGARYRFDPPVILQAGDSLSIHGDKAMVIYTDGRTTEHQVIREELWPARDLAGDGEC